MIFMGPRKHWCILPRDVRTLTFCQMGFPFKPLKVKRLAGGQKASEERSSGSGQEKLRKENALEGVEVRSPSDSVGGGGGGGWLVSMVISVGSRCVFGGAQQLIRATVVFGGGGCSNKSLNSNPVEPPNNHPQRVPRDPI